MSRCTSEVLDLAADVVEKRGWTTGVWNNIQEDRPVCIEGGIAAALGYTVDLGIAGLEGEYDAFMTCPAYQAVSEYLGVDVLYHWNDAIASVGVWEDGQLVAPAKPAHTQAEVVEVLRAAAAVERAKEESLEGAEVIA